MIGCASVLAASAPLRRSPNLTSSNVSISPKDQLVP